MPRNPVAHRIAQLANVALAVKALDALKIEAGCKDCGYRKTPGALQFDHVDPSTKRADLGWMACRSKLTTKARLARYLDHVDRYCEIRCANCHTERSIREEHWRGPRGLQPISDDWLLFSA